MNRSTTVLRIRRIACLLGAIALQTSTAAANAVNEKIILFDGGSVVSGLPNYHSYRIPAIVRAANGNLVAIAEGRVNNSADYGDIDVVYRVHNGTGWGPIRRMWSKHANTCGNPTALLDAHTGRIWVMLNYNDGDKKQFITDANGDGFDDEDGRTRIGVGDRKVYVTWSDDHGATFAQPIHITSSVQPQGMRWDAVGPGLGIQLQRGPHAGRLVFPAINRHIYSDDHGVTWRSGMVVNPGTSEATLVELTDGTLYRNDRAVTTAMKCVFRRPTSMSFDDGESWTPWDQNNTLLAPGHYDEVTGCPTQSNGIKRCHASTMRYTASEPFRIMFTNPASSVRRRFMTIRISYDEGETWPIGRRLYSGASAYSALVKTPDNMTGVLYEQADGEHQDIAFHKVNLSWILNGAREPVYPAGNRWLGDYETRLHGWYQSPTTGWVYPDVTTRADYAQIFFYDVGTWFEAWRWIPGYAWHPTYGWRPLPPS